MIGSDAESHVMRTSRFHFSVRRMMVGVGIVALLLGGLVFIGRMRQRSAAYHRRAQAYAWIAFHMGSGILVDGEWVERDPVVRARDSWARAMARKYWRLSDYPWLPVGDDPTPPPEAVPELTERREPRFENDMMNWSLRWTDPPRWTFLWTWRR